MFPPSERSLNCCRCAAAAAASLSRRRLGRKKQRDKIFGGANLEMVKVGGVQWWVGSGVVELGGGSGSAAPGG